MDMDRMEATINVLKIEKYKPKEKIIKYGEDGDRIYFILKGTVTVEKPKIKVEKLTCHEFVQLLNDIEAERDYLKLDRITGWNVKEMYLQKLDDYYLDKNTKYNNVTKRNFLIEENILIHELKDGDEFGEVALLQNTKRY